MSRAVKRHQGQKTTFEDPVCGMEVSHKSAAEELEYRGKRYYFCSGGCREQFEAEPERFLRVHRQRGARPA